MAVILEVSTDVIEMIQPGNAVRLTFPDIGQDNPWPNPNNGIRYIRAIIDGYMVVHREWSRKLGGYWKYDVEPLYVYQMYRDKGYLSQ